MTEPAPLYAELAVATNFSFLRGASRPEELVLAATLLGHHAIGIADRNSLAGVVRAYTAFDHPELAKMPRPKLLVGARLVFSDQTPDILAYPTNRESYGRLCRLLSRGKLRAKKGDCTLTFDDLIEWQEGLLLAVIPPQRIAASKHDPRAQAPLRPFGPPPPHAGEERGAVGASCLQPFDGADGEAVGGDAGARGGEVFDHDLHRSRAGVKEAGAVEHRAHVAFPEDEVAAFERRVERDGFAEC